MAGVGVFLNRKTQTPALISRTVDVHRKAVLAPGPETARAQSPKIEHVITGLIKKGKQLS